MTILIPLV